MIWNYEMDNFCEHRKKGGNGIVIPYVILKRRCFDQEDAISREMRPYRNEFLTSFLIHLRGGLQLCFSPACHVQ